MRFFYNRHGFNNDPNDYVATGPNGGKPPEPWAVFLVWLVVLVLVIFLAVIW